MAFFSVTLALAAAIAVVTVIIFMMVGSVRSTKGGTDWSPGADPAFRPWEDNDDN